MSLDALVEQLRAAALGYPETLEDFPWGESAFKVRGKVFLFLHRTEGAVSFTVKLPRSHLIAAELPGCRPTGYGLGRSGWITKTLDDSADIDIDQLRDWLDESFRAVAPKTVVKQMDRSA